MTTSMEILFEDNHLIAVNKPGGILTQPSGTEQDNLEDQVKSWIKQKYQKPGNVFLQALHRLDKPASGVVLFAKTSKALSRLNVSMREKQTCKQYLVRIEGHLKPSSGTLEHFLVHDEFHARVVEKGTEGAKLARLQYQVLEEKGDFSLLKVELETGRYHQIRAQLAHMGCPIQGDYKYGSKKPFKEGAIALHHVCLEIVHPITSLKLLLQAQLPLYWPSL